MQSASCLIRRGAVYYVRRRIPKTLQFHYGNRRELVRSLGTKEPNEARRRLHAALVALDTEWERLRSAGLTAQDAPALADVWLSRLLQADEEKRAAGDRAALEREEDALEDHEHDLREALATGAPDAALAREAVELAKEAGFVVAEGAEGHRALVYELAKARVRYLEAFRDRQRGRLVPTPTVPAPTVPTVPKGHSLMDAFEAWAGAPGRLPKTALTFKSVAALFHAQHSRLRLSQVGRSHVRAFVDAQLAAGKSPKTVSKYVDALRAILGAAVDREWINANPAAGVRVATPKGLPKPRRPFTSDELNRLFRGPVHAEGRRPKAGGGEAAYWLPLLGLYTGARLEELCQLKTDDFTVEQGALCLTITDEGGRRVKTHTSRRRLPVHPTLLCLGFREYLEGRRAGSGSEGAGASDGWLFPDLEPDSLGQRSGRWTKWFGRYVDEVVGPDARIVFHSFRHGFKAACRACEVPEDVHDALTGHSNGSVGRSYGGTWFPLRPLVAAVNRLEFEGLDVGGIKPWGQ